MDKIRKETIEQIQDICTRYVKNCIQESENKELDIVQQAIKIGEAKAYNELDCFLINVLIKG